MSLDSYSPSLKDDPSAMNLTWRKRYFSLMKYLKCYFRFEVEGLERIPAEGPAIITPFHGLLPVDVQLLIYEIWKRYGRIVRILTDHRVFSIPYLRRAFLDLGALDGTHGNGEHFLKVSRDLLIISPGGAREGWRSSFFKYQLSWERRYGFIKLALRTGVPIIPVFTAGIDELYFNPINGMVLAEKLLGKDFPLPLTIPFGLGPLPLPIKLTQYIGEPIHFDLPPEAADDKQTVEACQLQARAALEKLIARHVHGPKLYELRKMIRSWYWDGL